ncbi:MAG: HEPN domain-containing protein, partial [Chitinophagaceae bacterium]
QIQNLILFTYYNTAVNRLYYASFYAVQALLFTIDIKPKTHSGILNMFSLHFVKQGKIPVELSDFYATIYHHRNLADYFDIDEYDKETVEIMYSSAKNFIEFIDALIFIK